MTSTNFLVASIDKNFNMFKVKEGNIEFIAKIAEHIKRLEEISENHHFYIDDVAWEALGKTSFPLRFTRVFSEKADEIPRSLHYRIHEMKDLKDIVMSKERFSPDTQIFFIGSNDFLIKCAPFAKKLLLTVVDIEHSTSNSDIFSPFPLNEFKEIFFKRRSIHPEMLEQIKEYRRIATKHVPKQKVTIAENGMKIIETEFVPEIDASDDILNTPDYMFYEYAR